MLHRFLSIILTFLLGLLSTLPVFADCRPEMLPKIVPGQASGTAQYVWAVPRGPGDPVWGHLQYPIKMTFTPNLISVSLISLRAQTHFRPGFLVQLLGLGGDTDTRYVLGLSGQHYKWVPDGIKYIWYDVPDYRIINGVGSDGVTPQAEYYIPYERWDSEGFTGQNLSDPMAVYQEVSLGVDVVAGYPEPVLVEVQLKMKVCR